MSWFSIIILLGALQGFFLAVGLLRLPKESNRSNLILAIFLIIVTLTLLGRFAYDIKPATLFYAKVLFIGDFLVFLYGPMLYLYLRSLLYTERIKLSHVLLHLVPSLVFTILITPMMFTDIDGFREYIVSYSDVFLGVELFGILQNTAYLSLCVATLIKFSRESDLQYSSVPKLTLYKILLGFSIIAVNFWAVSFAEKLFYSIDDDYLLYQLVWITLSGSVIVMGYYSITNPGIFLAPIQTEKPAVEPTTMDEEKANELSERLKRIMIEKKPYLQAKLSISELSEISNIPMHTLSKLLNEKFNMNFFDFINQYRIEEFKLLIDSPEYKNLTILGVAYHAGFNSKTTFNTAFKKLTNLTPSNFVKQNKADL